MNSYSTSDEEQCFWCERQRELVDDEYSSGYLVSDPDGNVLTIDYGLVCRECWDDIERQWRETGDLTKPLAAYGDASA
jgi:hypothetical protein